MRYPRIETRYQGLTKWCVLFAAYHLILILLRMTAGRGEYIRLSPLLMAYRVFRLRGWRNAFKNKSMSVVEVCAAANKYGFIAKIGKEKGTAEIKEMKVERIPNPTIEKIREALKVSPVMANTMSHSVLIVADLGHALEIINSATKKGYGQMQYREIENLVELYTFNVKIKFYNL